MGKQIGTVISYGGQSGSIQGTPPLFSPTLRQLTGRSHGPDYSLRNSYILINMATDFTGVTMSGIKAPVLQWLRSCFSGKGFPWFVLVCMLTATTGLWQYAEITLINQSLDRFHSRVEKQKTGIVNRLQDYIQALHATAGLFATADEVTRASWHDYVSTLKPERYLAGSRGLGIQDPLGKVVFIEPPGDHLNADPVLRMAMEQARDSGQITLSRRITSGLTTDALEPADFVLYLAIYQQREPVDTMAARRRALLGFAYIPFRAAEFMQSVLAEQVNRDVLIELFDGKPARENRLYSSVQGDPASRYATERELAIDGHIWTLHFRSTPEFDDSTVSRLPLFIRFGGMALDLLLFVVLFINSNRLRTIRELTVRLELTDENFNRLEEHLSGAVFRVKPEFPWQAQYIGHGIEALTGIPQERFLTKALSLDQVIHPDDQARFTAAVTEAKTRPAAFDVTLRIKRDDGRILWSNLRGRVLYDESGTPLWLEGVMFDVSRFR